MNQWGSFSFSLMGLMWCTKNIFDGENWLMDSKEDNQGYDVHEALGSRRTVSKQTVKASLCCPSLRATNTYMM